MMVKIENVDATICFDLQCGYGIDFDRIES